MKLRDFPFQLIDLSHTITPTIATWEGQCGFISHNKADYDDHIGSCQFRVQAFEVLGSSGTHLDAPAHCFPNHKTIDRLKIEDLICSCYVINISQKAHESYCLTPQDIEYFEKTYGKIQAQSFVLVYTGWSKFWSNPLLYRNNLKFPTISEEASHLLLEYNLKGIGIDTLSPDSPESTWPVHRHFLGNGLYILENIANADLLPPIGSYIGIFPIKLAQATESPTRAIGFIPS